MNLVMREKRIKYPPNGFRVCIDSRESDIGGVAYSPLVEQEITYNGINELILEMDRIFDQKGYPQAFQEKRSFFSRKKSSTPYRGVPEVIPDAEKIYEKTGKIFTVDVVVEARRNASWQGYIRPVDGAKIKRYQGELELLQLLLEY